MRPRERRIDPPRPNSAPVSFVATTNVAAAPARGWIEARGASLRIAVAMLACAVLAAVALPADIARALASEQGPIETLQALLLFAVAAGIWLAWRQADDAMTAMALSTLLTAMAARELEWHRAWTSGNVLKLSFYFGPAAASEKIAGAAALIAMAIAAGYLVKRHARWAIGALRERDPLAFTIAMFLVSLAATRLVDKSLRFAEKWFGWSASPSAIVAKLVVEEVLELAIPLLALLGLLQHRARRGRATGAR